jgi:hypothetical protein
VYEIHPILVADMSCLVELLGLYKVFNPNSKWKCPWCEADVDHLHDWSVESWPFRDLEKCTTIGNSYASSNVHSTRSAKAGINYGIMVGFLIRIS